ncbi:MAG: hypothetical protein WD266_13985 [Balneolales bacterium]
MFINYRRLFNLQVDHGYFIGKNPAGLQITPHPESRKKLRNSKMLAKPLPNGVTVLYSAGKDEVEPLVHLDKLRLIFSVSAPEPAVFQTITDLDESATKKFASSRVLYFKNDTAAASDENDLPEQIGHILLDSVQPQLFTFTWRPEQSPQNLLFELRNERDEKVSPQKDAHGEWLPDQIELEKLEDKSFRQQIDLRGRPSGRYTICLWESEEDDEPRYREDIFVDDWLSGRAPLGILELDCGAGDGDLYTKTQEYALVFRRKEVFWKYLVVSRNGRIDQPEELTIEEGDTSDNVHYDPVLFSRQDDLPDEDHRPEGGETYVFRSEGPIPLLEIPLSSLQLKESDNKVLISNLPNPSPLSIIKENDNQLESEIYVFV